VLSTARILFLLLNSEGETGLSPSLRPSSEHIPIVCDPETRGDSPVTPPSLTSPSADRLNVVGSYLFLDI